MVSLKVLSEEVSPGWRTKRAGWQEYLCRCRHRCGRLVGQLHHVDIVASTAEPLDAGGPTEFSKIEGCDVTLESALVVDVNMIEPFRSGLDWLVV